MDEDRAFGKALIVTLGLGILASLAILVGAVNPGLAIWLWVGSVLAAVGFGFAFYQAFRRQDHSEPAWNIRQPHH